MSRRTWRPPSDSCAPPPPRARLVLIPELFERPYFCKDMLPEHFARARPLDGHPTVEHFRGVAAELDIVLPLSVYERANHATYNSVVVVDADGAVLGTYRKSHIPDGPGYTEKYCFNAGETGFEAWDIRTLSSGGRLLGTVVPADVSRHGADGRPGAVLPTRSAASRPTPSDAGGRSQLVMQGHAGADPDPARRRQPGRSRSRRCHRDHVLRIVGHRRSDRRTRSPKPARRRGRADGDVRPRRSAAGRHPGGCSGSPSRPLRPVADTRRTTRPSLTDCSCRRGSLGTSAR